MAPDHGSVQCGGRATVAIQGSATMLLHIQPGYRQYIKFYMTSLPVGLPLILGITWLIANQVILMINHANPTMQVTKNGQDLRFPMPGGHRFH